MAFPSIFTAGTCDTTSPLVKSLKFDEWVEHIYYNVDNRVAQHPFLKFFLLNLKLRVQALNQGSFLVRQQLQDAHLTIPELRENIANSDDSVPRKIVSIAKNFINSSPYWKFEKQKLDALICFRKKEYGDMAAYFDTNSCAEFHWKPLHQLLIKYEAKIANEEEQVLAERFQNDSSFRHKTILKNSHIVSHYFDCRVLNYMATVGVELFQFTDFWFRYEFAIGRGAIHSHGILFSEKHANMIKSALDVDDNLDIVAQHLEQFLQSQEKNTEEIFSPEFCSLHPAGGVEVDGEWVPNKSLWAEPEGSAKKPNDNPLARDLSDVIHVKNGVRDMHVDVINKVGLHKCCSYCLKRKKAPNPKDKNSIKTCRFHFGDYDPTTKKSEGKMLHPFKPIISGAEHKRYEGKRDHPRQTQNIKCRSLSWKANCDTQVLIEESIIALQNYLTPYTCKGASSTDDFIQLYKLLIDSVPDTSTVKSLTQKLLLKIVGLIDVPEVAVDFINTGGRLVRSTRAFRPVGISGYRMLDDSGNSVSATKPSTLDQFLSEKRREADPDISLYDWAKICNCKCKCEHVPVFTGVMNRPVWPPSEEFARATLMCFSPGTWTTIDDLKFGRDSFVNALLDFVEMDCCPDIVRKMLFDAKQSFDKKRKLPIARDHACHSQVNLSQSSQCSQSSSQNSSASFQGNSFNFREAMYRDLISDVEIPEQLLETPFLDVGDDFDWHEYSIECLGDLCCPSNAKTWVSDQCKSALESVYCNNDLISLPDVNVLRANNLQRVIIGAVMRTLLRIKKGENVDQFPLLVVGTAGTGKTFVINCITRLTRRLFNKNNSVLNLAPTGAAAVLLPDGRTLHSTTPIPRLNKREAENELNDCPLSNDKLRELRSCTGPSSNRKLFLLNLDERGMTSHNVAAWCSQRFKESLCEFDLPFGGIPCVNWVGDHGQLSPFGGDDLHNPPKFSSTPAIRAGYALYQLFENVIILQETMRQKPDQKVLLERLLRIRRGEITQDDWNAINSRYEGDLSEPEKKKFKSSSTITLCETWAEVNVENHCKLAALNVPIAVIPALSRGPHMQGGSDTPLGQIPARALIGVGCRVMLTKNQNGLTIFGLNNGAFGTVRAILYDEGEKPPSFPAAVIVEFPNYSGPPWIPEYPTWIPITENIGFCEAMCCSRKGLPLMPGYSITIAKSQGSTIGENQSITHMRLKLQNTTNFEILCPGTLYTGLSRVDKDDNWSLVDKIDWTRLQCINSSKAIEKRRQEDERLLVLHNKTLKKLSITENDFINLIAEIDEESNDGIFDSIQV